MVAGGVGSQGVVEEEPVGILEMGWLVEMIDQFTHDIDELKDRFGGAGEVEKDGARTFVSEGPEGKAQFVGRRVAVVECLILILYIDRVMAACSRGQGGARSIVGDVERDT